MAKLRKPINVEEDDALITAAEEMRARDQWVAWKYVVRNDAKKPTKVPIDPNTEAYASSTKPSTWGSFKQALHTQRKMDIAGIGFMLAPDDDITGIDLDSCRDPDTGEFEPWAAEIVSLAESYTEISPSKKGIRIFARGKVPKATCPKKGNSRVEIYSYERFLTMTFDHIDGTPEDIREAPQTIAKLLARVESFKTPEEKEIERKATERAANGPAPKFESNAGAREQAWADKALDGVRADLASVGSGGRNSALNAAAYRMGRIIARGWVDESAVRGALEDACRANGLWKDDGPSQCRKTIDSGLSKGRLVPREDLEEREEDAELDRIGEQIARGLMRKAGVAFDPETGEVFEEPAKEKERLKNEDAHKACHELPDHLTRPAGVLSEITDWIVDSAQRPNRVLALCAAITTLGTIIGRRVAGPTNSGTHLYLVALAGSAAGKDHPLRRAGDILRAVNPALIGPGEFMSQSALAMSVSDQPLSLCPMDEIGAFVRRLCHHNAGGWERGIIKLLREYWSASFETVAGINGAARKIEPITWPALSIFGVSTHQEFFDALSSKEATNGFLNRFLLLATEARVQFVDEPSASKLSIPPTITQRISHLWDRCRGDAVPKQAILDPSLLNGAGQIKLKWANDEIRAASAAFVRETIELSESAAIGEIYGRTAEMAIRLATIHAVSRAGLQARVEPEDFAWGRDLALWSANTMAREASMRMSDTEAQSRANFVLRVIHSSGGTIKRRDLSRKLQHRFKFQELSDVIAALVDSGAIEQTSVQPAGGGPKTFIYTLRGRTQSGDC